MAQWQHRARGDDALSDVDVHIVVADADATELCARPRQLAAQTTPERLDLFSRFGQPAIIHENQHNAPPGGSFTCVIYASLLTVDWVLVPQSSAVRPPETRLLFDTAAIPSQPPPPLLSAAPRAERAAERIAFFWMMMSIAAKTLVRGDAVGVNHLLTGLQPLIREVRGLTTGVPIPYTRRASFSLAVTAAEQVAVVRQLCDEILALSPAVVALGGSVPAAPLAIIDGILAALREDSP